MKSSTFKTYLGKFFAYDKKKKIMPDGKRIDNRIEIVKGKELAG